MARRAVEGRAVKPDAKVAERIQKLLRLASPKSGSTEAERASAALTALDLADRHGITLDVNTAHAKADHSPATVRNVWLRTQAQDTRSCSVCGNRISRGDMVFVRAVPATASFEYRHHYAPCAVE